MAHTASGNATWADYPSTSTLITAASLESIENVLDAQKAAQAKSFAMYVPSNTGTGNAQSIPSATATNLLFGGATVTSSAVTRATGGAGHVFTLTRAGLWIVTAFCRLQAGGTSAYNGLNLTTSAASHGIATNAITTNAITILTVTSPILAAVNDTVTINVYQERGVAVSTVDNATGVRLAWIGSL